MAYKKTNWVDNETPISAENLNKMEDGIVEASKTGGILEGSIIEYEGDTIPEGYEEVVEDNVLWTNPNPTAEFSAQTITLKENDYKYFRIKFKNLSNDRIWFFEAEANTTFQVIMNGLYTPAGKGYLTFFYRSDCSCTQTSMTFDDGKYISGVDTTINDRNDYIIPLKVVGYNL